MDPGAAAAGAGQAAGAARAPEAHRDAGDALGHRAGDDLLGVVIDGLAKRQDAEAQSCVLRASLIVLMPGHSAPPQLGCGLSQSRVTVRVPPPHSAEQGPQTHSPQPPLSGSQSSTHSP